MATAPCPDNLCKSTRIFFLLDKFLIALKLSSIYCNSYNLPWPVILKVKPCPIFQRHSVFSYLQNITGFLPDVIKKWLQKTNISCYWVNIAYKCKVLRIILTVVLKFQEHKYTCESLIHACTCFETSNRKKTEGER